MSNCEHTVFIRMPWWASIYLIAFKVFAAVQPTDADPDVAAEFVVRHARITTK